MKIKNSTALLLATILTFSVGVFTLKTESFYKVKADDTETINLDERDVQAYFNGTLVFYKEDSSSQTA